MAVVLSSMLFTLFFFSFLLSTILSPSQAQIDDVTTTSINLVTDALEDYNWPSALSSSLYDADFEADEEHDDDAIGGDNDLDVSDGTAGRRSLFWQTIGRRRRYYISYGVLFANRIPCPPRSGRSYYTHNCYKARGPAHPYTRGCSAITRCRR